jgi:hypothetical protein
MNRGTGLRSSQPAYYHIYVPATLNARRFGDYIGMWIKFIIDVSDRAVTRRSGALTDQSAPLDMLNLLHDLRVPILARDYLPYSQD